VCKKCIQIQIQYFDFDNTHNTCEIGHPVQVYVTVNEKNTLTHLCHSFLLSCWQLQTNLCKIAAIYILISDQVTM